MSTLQNQLNRLYRMQPSEGALLADGRARALVLELARPADWTALSVVWRGVQTDLQWPAPAIAVSGVDGYQLWFALAEPVSVAEGQVVLQALCARYLASVTPARLRLFPTADGTEHAREVPALQAENQLWSAFVAPDLATIFADEPWLDVPPGPEAQASLLAQLQCVKQEAVQALLASVVPVARAVPSKLPAAATVAAPTLVAAQDPQAFLRAVMADTSVELRLRVDAAIALLPYAAGAAG